MDYRISLARRRRREVSALRRCFCHCLAWGFDTGGIVFIRGPVFVPHARTRNPDPDIANFRLNCPVLPHDNRVVFT